LKIEKEEQNVFLQYFNPGKWKPIVCGNNQNSHTKGEPGCQSLLFTNF